jgi:long-chain acyl-CoA synthetase
MKRMSQESALKRKIFDAALKISRQRNELLEFGKPVGAWLTFKHRLVDKIVFSKIRERMGGQLTYMSSGGAAASLKVLHFFEDIGIPICEGYGLTETSPVITASKPDSWKNRRLGTCGVPLKGVDLKIFDPETKRELEHDSDGEVCVSGPNVMVGYRNNPKANEEVFFHKDGKRYFRTGDLGRMVEGRFLKITGRIKEQYKLENGKYVVPAPLEDAMTRSHFVAQSFLYGDNKPYNVAIIVPDFVELRAWAKKNNVEGWTDDVSLLNHSAVLKLYGDELQHVCSLMKSYERPGKWCCIMEPFTQENQMMTPKMSFRRNNIMKAYAPLIEDMYNNKSGTKVTYVSSASHE